MAGKCGNENPIHDLYYGMFYPYREFTSCFPLPYLTRILCYLKKRLNLNYIVVIINLKLLKMDGWVESSESLIEII